MNNYATEARRRGRSLLVVEGDHEKNELFWLVFKCYPELHVDMENIWIYGTNIYMLYEDIIREYGDDWENEWTDIDLPFVISKKKNLENLCYKNDFTNIILVFDYERHDPQFSADKILRLQNYFSDAADMGKLYLNYPMIESYQHLKSLPDEEYINRKISVSLQPGSKYKELVRNESVIEKAVDFPHRIEALLAGTRYRIEDADKRQICCDKILNISNDSEMERSLEEILRVVDDDKKARTLKYQLKDWIEKVRYTHENRTYWKHMREVIGKIVCHNIEKAYVIQHEDRNDSNDRKLTEQFEQVDLSQILNVQNEVSQDMENGFIWVLNTCIFLIPDYNFRLIA